MQLIAAPWCPDYNAEHQQAQDLAEAWCLDNCEYAKVCHVVGEHGIRDCRLAEDERNSRY